MKITVIFPGYGSQFVGMAKELYDESRLIQEYFEEASSCVEKNFIKLCFASSDAELARMANAYTATFLVSVSIYKLLEEEGLRPTMYAGFNFGEWAALCAAGAFGLPDGLYLLNKFARFYEEALEQMDVMTIRVQGIPTEDLQNRLEKYENLHITIIESSMSHIVGGKRTELDSLCNELDLLDKKIKTNIIDSSIGLHSAVMMPVIDQFKMYLEKIDFKNITVPVISSVAQKELKTARQIKDHLIALLHEQINWPATIQHCLDADYIIEIGPGSSLSAKLKKEFPEKTVVSINKKADVDALKELLGLTKVENEEKDTQTRKDDQDIKLDIVQQKTKEVETSTE